MKRLFLVLGLAMLFCGCIGGGVYAPYAPDAVFPDGSTPSPSPSPQPLDESNNTSPSPSPSPQPLDESNNTFKLQNRGCEEGWIWLNVPCPLKHPYYETMVVVDPDTGLNRTVIIADNLIACGKCFEVVEEVGR